MMPTSAHANAGQSVSACAESVALAAAAVMPVGVREAVKKSIYSH